jgi:transcriptional regulator PpsR
MTALTVAQPDVTLLLDLDGVIRDVTLSGGIAESDRKGWVGRPWNETVADVGADKVRRMVEDARANRVSAFRQVTQRFPSGRELLLEYTTVRLGGDAGLLAIGRNLQAVADLQSRLISAQQAMERDYWKLRQIETRYRILFEESAEAVLLLRASDLHIVEANAAAMRALNLAAPKAKGPFGRDFLSELPPEDHEQFQSTLMQVREHGRAPGILIHLGRHRTPWLVRVSLMVQEPAGVYLLQLSHAANGQPALDNGDEDGVDVDELIDRNPDGFIIVGNEGTIVRANRAFLDLVQIGAKGGAVGENLGRWLGRPGADLTVLLATVRRHGVVRLFSTTIHGELGTDTEVELSAAGDADGNPRYISILLRDVGRRLAPTGPARGLDSVLLSLTEQIGKTTLRKLVKTTVGAVERHYVEAALEITDGNRTAAAELLGLSRQSLYAKLDRYGISGDAGTGSKPG